MHDQMISLKSTQENQGLVNFTVTGSWTWDPRMFNFGHFDKQVGAQSELL